MNTDRPSQRLHRWSVGLMAMVLVTLLAPTAAAQAQVSKLPATVTRDDVPVPPDTGLRANGIGSVSAADRDFVTKVRLAGLWEIPAGNIAQEKSNNPQIVKIGKEIARQHGELDRLAREAATKLQIALPSEPTPEQQFWLREMQSANNTDFNQIYIDRLRAAHGNIFPAIANIRAGTRSDVVRRLAQQTNQFVMTHLTLLESSGLVDYGSLPQAPQPAAAAPAVDWQMREAALNSGLPGINTSVILVVLAAALIAGVVTTMRIFRTR